jgi:hypothetical protein
MDKLTPQELKDYKAMLSKQHRKPKSAPKSPTSNVKNVITDAYVQSLCIRRGIVIKEPLQISPEMKDNIQNLYIKGVLPIRLGGINL